MTWSSKLLRAAMIRGFMPGRYERLSSTCQPRACAVDGIRKGIRVCGWTGQRQIACRRLRQ
jgi:hypothetical protein